VIIQELSSFLQSAPCKSHTLCCVINNFVITRDFPLLLIIEYMNEGDLLGVLHDSRPKMPLQRQLRFAIQVADGMDYLSTELCVN